MVIAEHIFDDGQVWPAVFEALANEDASARLAVMKTAREAERGVMEIASNLRQVATLGKFAVVTFLSSTVAENVAALREAYLTATDIQCIWTGEYLSTLTDAQLRTAFNMTQAQVNSLRTNKLTPAANTAATIRAATGA